MNRSSGNAFFGILISAAIGVAAGMLFAPRRGKETRNEIKRRADEISREVSSKVGQKFDEMKHYVEGMAKEKAKKIEQV
jgi:gas vesicle protein